MINLLHYNLVRIANLLKKQVGSKGCGKQMAVLIKMNCLVVNKLLPHRGYLFVEINHRCFLPVRGYP